MTLVNAGDIGANPSTTNVDTVNGVMFTSSINNSLGSPLSMTNAVTGVIAGRHSLSTGSSIHGLAVHVNNGVGGATTIQNAGLIYSGSGTGAFERDPGRPSVMVRGGGATHFTNLGSIVGAVGFAEASGVGAGNTFINAGRLDGSVSLGTQNNTFIAVTGSSIIGSRLGGDQTLVAAPDVAFASPGWIDGGSSGNNSVILSNQVPGGDVRTGTTNIDGSAFRNFQSLVVESGTWTVGGTFSVNEAKLSGGVVELANGNAFGSSSLFSDGGSIAAAAPGLTVSNPISLGINGLTLSGPEAMKIEGAVSGTGGLIKRGSGMLTLSGDATHTGGTVINGGALQITGPRYSGPIDIDSGAQLIVTRPGTNTVLSNDISGEGSVVLAGNNTHSFSGINTYSGGTTISSGRLLGSTSTLQGNIINNARLDFEQSSNGAYAGDISGGGTFVKTGASSLTMRGQFRQGGTTEIQAGTLQLNDLRYPGGIQVFDIQSGGTLAVNTASDLEMQGSVQAPETWTNSVSASCC